jgi:hypothetical protein
MVTFSRAMGNDLKKLSTHSAVSDRYGFFPSSHSEVKSGVKVHPSSTAFKGSSVLFLGNELDVVACTGDWLSDWIGFYSRKDVLTF